MLENDLKTKYSWGENDLKTKYSWGVWVAQLVKHQTLKFGSGHDPRVGEFQPGIRLQADSGEPA